MKRKPLEVALLVVTTGLVACSSSVDSKPFTACRLGELRGTWRVAYTETDGNCGRIPDETVSLQPGSSAVTASATCTYAANAISADKCRLDSDFTCPLVGVAGTQHWVGVTRQTGPGSLHGSMTVSLDSTTDGTCRSTYDVDWSQQ